MAISEAQLEDREREIEMICEANESAARDELVDDLWRKYPNDVLGDVIANMNGRVEFTQLVRALGRGHALAGKILSEEVERYLAEYREDIPQDEVDKRAVEMEVGA